MDCRYNKILNKAYTLHKNGKLDEAEELYKELLQIKPDDSNILNLYSLLCLSKGDTKLAIDLLSKALVLNNNPEIMSNLAKAYYMAGDVENSIEFYNKAALIKPNDDIYYSLGISYKEAKEFEKAIEAYNKALELNPNNYNVLYNLAILYKNQNKYNLALNTALRAEFINTNDENIHSLLSELFQHNWKYKEAIKHLKKAYELNQKNYLYLYNQGILYNKLDEHKKAIKCYKKVLEQEPEHIITMLNLSNIYEKIQEHNESLKYLELAYSHNPKEEHIKLSLAAAYKRLCFNEKSIEILKTLNSPKAYSLLAVCFAELSQYEMALTNIDKALSLDESSKYLIERALILNDLGKFNEAKEILESLDCKSYKYMMAMSSIYLQEKNFEKGMELYIKRSTETKFYDFFRGNIWHKGCSLKDCKVILFSDCGLGDTIMFARYIPLLQKIAKKIIIKTDRPLIPLLKQSFPNIEVYPKSEENISYDVAMPIMNLAYALNIDFENIPFSGGYLYSDKAKIKSDKLKVGIFYQGNKYIFKNRAIPFDEIKRINSDKIQLYSFQIKDYEKEDDSVIKLRKRIKDYSDTARLLKSMDVLVTVDSSIAHCAGALGVKTFLLLPYAAEWRWFHDDYSTPWYKSVRIFKQTSPNDWKSVIDRVIEELK